jgi:surface protein
MMDNLDLSNLDVSNVTTMTHMFDSCMDLTKIDFTGFDTSSVTDMSYMFYDCRTMTSLNIDVFDMSAVTNFDYMFANSVMLRSISTYSLFSSLKSAKNMFENLPTDLEEGKLLGYSRLYVRDVTDPITKLNIISQLPENWNAMNRYAIVGDLS